MKASGVLVVAVFISSLCMAETREGKFPIILLLDKCVLDLLAVCNHYDSLVDTQGLAEGSF